MQPRSPDESDYCFLTAPGAGVHIALAADPDGQPELHIFGNRAGLLSLANVLLWFVANAWRREFLLLAELPFVHLAGSLSVCLRMTAGEPTGRAGSISRSDRGEQSEWSITEGDLQRLALAIHRLVSGPTHEYDRLLLEEDSNVGAQVRMTNAADWIARGRP